MRLTEPETDAFKSEADRARRRGRRLARWSLALVCIGILAIPSALVIGSAALARGSSWIGAIGFVGSVMSVVGPLVVGFFLFAIAAGDFARAREHERAATRLPLAVQRLLEEADQSWWGSWRSPPPPPPEEPGPESVRPAGEEEPF